MQHARRSVELRPERRGGCNFFGSLSELRDGCSKRFARCRAISHQADRDLKTSLICGCRECRWTRRSPVVYRSRGIELGWRAILGAKDPCRSAANKAAADRAATDRYSRLRPMSSFLTTLLILAAFLSATMAMALRRFRLRLFFALAVLLPGIGAAAEQTVPVSTFWNGVWTDWEAKIFKGKTAYSFTFDPEKSATVVEAWSRAAASGRYRKIKVDLVRTPFLNWSWKVAEPLSSLDENTKAGDDFAARLYVVVERGMLGLSSFSMNYVWANQHPAGAAWPSPFTRSVRLLAVDSGSAHLNSWISHKRNVREDFKAQFGEDIRSIDAVALMTDTDNSGQSAHAFYGDIWFSSQ